MRTFFPALKPFKTEYFRVSSEHELYLEQAGNPEGCPILFLHGGPGAGLSEYHRRFFDPKFYRVVLFDQRGAGKSKPHASLENNTTWDLVADIEKIREHLGIPSWTVFGGSWGSTLALAYAETHPERVKGLILRGIFLCRKSEIRWFYQEGAHHLFPDQWEKYLEPIDVQERGDLVRAYYKRLTSDDESVRLRAAKAWSGWEGSTLKLIPNPTTIADFESAQKALSVARIECHYFSHDSFLEEDDQLVKNVDKIRHIPTVIVHGRYDVVCPVRSAWDLHRVFPEAKLEIIPDAGHAADEPGIIDALVRATDDFKKLYAGK